MEFYIQISLLNDFIFCPKSIYFHKLYQKYASVEYKDTPQKVGTLKHETIDENRYSNRKEILQGIPIFSEKYNIGGKIDIFNKKTGELVERKNKIKTIYDGYRYQVYAQYFCLKEMGYKVKKILLHSLSDNKRYLINIPGKKEIAEFESLIAKIREFSINQSKFKQNKEKCARCIYSELCDFYY